MRSSIAKTFDYIDVSVGDVEEFIKSILIVLSLSPLDDHSTIIYLNHILRINHNNRMSAIKSKAPEIIKSLEILCDVYNPVLKNNNCLQKDIWFHKQDFKDFFITARERLLAKSWLRETLKKRNINLENILDILN